MRNHSNENEFDLHKNGRAGETLSYMNGFARRFVLKQRQGVTRKWPIILDEPCKCRDAALGMESGVISDGQITASSHWGVNDAATQGRLNFEAGGGKQGAWSAKTNDANQWLQVDLGSRYIRVTRVATQGRNAASQWVTAYKLQYSKDGVTFQYFRERGQTTSKVKISSHRQLYYNLNNPLLELIEQS